MTDHAAHKSHCEQPHPYGYVGHKISSGSFTGNGGPDGDVGNGGGGLDSERLTKGARQTDAARREFKQVVSDFWAEREELHKDMGLLHMDRVDPRSIDGMV